ncbi:MAG TPA: ATP-dependent DNA helicase RecG, partial [Actinomycetota bacterium]
MTLELSTDVRLIDSRIANRRTGSRTKGPPAYEVLHEMGIATVGDLLHHYPRRYIDRSSVAAIRELRVGQQATVIGRVRRVAKRATRRRQSMVTVTVADGTGFLDLTFFNQPWLANTYKEGQELAVSGIAGMYRGRLQLANQEVEVLTAEGDTVHTGRITPVHPASEGVSTRTIRELVHAALARLKTVPDPVPSDVVRAERLSSFDEAIRAIHFPESQELLDAARERLKFDELFVLELGVAFRKHRVESQATGVGHDVEGALTRAFRDHLPFELTGAQERAIEEISAAMAAPRPMNTLLQGDVGSGKTVVAVHAALIAIQSGHQAAIMAPTEVLAGQHRRSVESLLAPIGAVRFSAAKAKTTKGEQASLLESEQTRPPVTYASLTGSVTGKERAAVLEAIADGAVDLVIGTHALVQEGVSFADLSLAVIDEQHRFGVHQRMALKGKGGEPDVLIMTATPIPRTLALTYYGDLDVSVVDEMPAGRMPVTTRIVRSDAEREGAYALVREEVEAGRQAFVVCAAIDEGNRSQVKAAEQEAERLATEVFPDLSVGVLHGRMRPA